MSSRTSSARLLAPAHHGTTIAAACWQRAAACVRTVAFWAAVVLPLAYLPAAYDVAGFEMAGSTLALFAVHVACFVIGHDHSASTPST